MARSASWRDQIRPWASARLAARSSIPSILLTAPVDRVEARPLQSASGFATVGLATETGLSIRGPASNTGIVGIAPSQGLVSRAGVIPISFTQDRVGVHAKSVGDAALVLSIICGFDAEDLATADSLGRTEPTSYAADGAGGLAGIRVGVLRDLFRKEREAVAGNAVIERQLPLLTASAVTGLPAVVVPAGLHPDGLPLTRADRFDPRDATARARRRRRVRCGLVHRPCASPVAPSGPAPSGTPRESRRWG